MVAFNLSPASPDRRGRLARAFVPRHLLANLAAVIPSILAAALSLAIAPGATDRVCAGEAQSGRRVEVQPDIADPPASDAAGQPEVSPREPCMMRLPKVRSRSRLAASTPVVESARCRAWKGA